MLVRQSLLRRLHAVLRAQPSSEPGAPGSATARNGGTAIAVHIQAQMWALRAEIWLGGGEAYADADAAVEPGKAGQGKDDGGGDEAETEHYHGQGREGKRHTEGV